MPVVLTDFDKAVRKANRNPTPIERKQLRAPAITHDLRRAVAAKVINDLLPKGLELIERTLDRGLKDLHEGLPVRREAIEAAKYAFGLAGLQPGPAREESAKDLSDMTKEELRAFVEIGQAKLKEAGSATIEGRLSDEVLDMFE